MIFFGILYSAYWITLLIRIPWQLLRIGIEPLQKSASLFGPAALIYTLAGPALGFYRYRFFGKGPFSTKYDPSLITVWLLAALSYWLLRLGKDRIGSGVRPWLWGGVLAGLALCLLSAIHFVPMVGMGMLFPLLGFELLAPYMALLLLVYELAVDRLRLSQGQGYSPAGAHQLWSRSLLACVVMLALVTAAFTALGYPADVMWKAFTETRGFLFSGRQDDLMETNYWNWH